MSGAKPDFTYRADMGFTRAELIKGLATAVVPYQIKDPNARVVELESDARRVELTTGADGFRAIASMRVPLLSVQLDFFGFDQDAYDAFMHRFKRYLHKGGG